MMGNKNIDNVEIFSMVAVGVELVKERDGMWKCAVMNE